MGRRRSRRRQYDDYGWGHYVSVAERRRNAARTVAALEKKGRKILPVNVEGRKIARTFWGEAWCGNLEAYSDFENRLPRGRTYVRNGSVVDLQVEPGRVTALVSGSELYGVEVKVKPLPARRWKALKQECAGGIDSLVELLQGALSKGVMEVVTRKGTGLFPAPSELSLECSCPDWADMCKHVAAALYGIGARLDDSPELIFVLRGVDPEELVEDAIQRPLIGTADSSEELLDASDLSSIFGDDIQFEAGPLLPRPSKRKRKVLPACAAEPEAPSILSQPLDALGLKRGAVSRLERATGVQTVGQLTTLRAFQIAGRHGVGRKTLADLRKALAARGLFLAED